MIANRFFNLETEGRVIGATLQKQLGRTKMLLGSLVLSCSDNFNYFSQFWCICVSLFLD